MTVVSDLTKKVTSALEENKQTEEYEFEIIDDEGLITIKGEVNSKEDEQKALEIVRDQEGVIKVIDEIVITEEKDKMTAIDADAAHKPPSTRPPSAS